MIDEEAVGDRRPETDAPRTPSAATDTVRVAGAGRARERFTLKLE